MKLKSLTALALLVPCVFVVSAEDISVDIPPIQSSAGSDNPPCGTSDVSALVQHIADKLGSIIGISGKDLIGALHRSNYANCNVACAINVPGNQEVFFRLENLNDVDNPLYCRDGGGHRNEFKNDFSSVKSIRVERQPNNDKYMVCAVFANWSHTTTLKGRIIHRPAGSVGWHNHCGDRSNNTPENRLYGR